MSFWRASYALLCGWPCAQAACETSFVKSVLAQHGGADVLAQISELRWTGHAVIHGERAPFEIRVRTTVVPFMSAHSESWLRTEDASNSRVMIIERERGWLERNGKRTPMPAAMFEHERAQFAIYGLMLLAPICDQATKVDEDTNARSIVVSHPHAPTTTLFFDRVGRLFRARNSVPSAEGGGLIEQEFRFSDERVPGPIHWPRTIRIRQNGKPYFDLTFEEFEAVTQR